MHIEYVLLHTLLDQEGWCNTKRRTSQDFLFEGIAWSACKQQCLQVVKRPYGYFSEGDNATVIEDANFTAMIDEAVAYWDELTANLTDSGGEFTDPTSNGYSIHHASAIQIAIGSGLLVALVTAPLIGF